MAGTKVEITLDDAEVLARLARTDADLGADGLVPLLEELGEVLKTATEERAAREVGPDGVRWPALSPRYAARKARVRPNAPMLVFDRHMLGDRLAWQIVGGTLYVGTSAKYGARHQFGGDFDMAARVHQLFFKQDRRTGEVGNRFVKRSKSNFAQTATSPAHSVHTPPRPFLGVSADDAAEIRDRTLHYLREVLAGG